MSKRGGDRVRSGLWAAWAVGCVFVVLGLAALGGWVLLWIRYEPFGFDVVGAIMVVIGVCLGLRSIPTARRKSSIQGKQASQFQKISAVEGCFHVSILMEIATHVKGGKYLRVVNREREYTTK